MKDVVTDGGDTFMRVCRMYTTINHRGIAYTTVGGTAYQQSTIGDVGLFAYTTINVSRWGRSWVLYDTIVYRFGDRAK